MVTNGTDSAAPPCRLARSHSTTAATPSTTTSDVIATRTQLDRDVNRPSSRGRRRPPTCTPRGPSQLATHQRLELRAGHAQVVARADQVTPRLVELRLR